jgi:glycogen phosphorylase
MNATSLTAIPEDTRSADDDADSKHLELNALVDKKNAQVERHILYDHVVTLEDADARIAYEAVARSVRDIVAQRWLDTQAEYARKKVKRIHYLSMEFLLGRSLADNVNNLKLTELAEQACKRKGLDWAALLEVEPDAGLGNGGLGRLAACFIESMATLGLPAIGYGLRYEYGIFRQTIQDGYQHEQPDNWLRRTDPWEVPRPQEQVEVALNCSFEIADGLLVLVPNKPSRLVGIPFDRPVVGYGGATINTLRLWSATVSENFDFDRFSSGDFVGAMTKTLMADSVTRVLYPDDSTQRGQALRFVQEYYRSIFSSPVPWPTSYDVSTASRATGSSCQNVPQFN